MDIGKWGYKLTRKRRYDTIKSNKDIEMYITKANMIARKLMRKHGIEDWEIRWTNAKKTYGYCDYGRRTLGFSKVLTDLNSEEEFTDVVLHEIAHALAPIEANHGKEWKRIAKRIGANPTRCYSNEVVRPPSLYITKCNHCGSVGSKNRRPRGTKTMACGNCCRKYNGGKYSDKYLLTYTKR